MVPCSSTWAMIFSIRSSSYPQPPESGRHRAVDDPDRAAADQVLVLDQRDVGLDPGGVAVHHEGDGPGRREHGGLRVAEAVGFSDGYRLVPYPAYLAVLLGGQVGVVERVAVLAHDAQERLGVLLVSGERAAAVAGDAGRLRVGLAGHHGRDGGCAAAGGVGVVGDGVRHQQRAQVRVAESQGAVGVRVAADRLGRVAGVVDQDLLGGDHGAHAGAEGVDVEPPRGCRA